MASAPWAGPPRSPQVREHPRRRAESCISRHSPLSRKGRRTETLMARSQEPAGKDGPGVATSAAGACLTKPRGLTRRGVHPKGTTRRPRVGHGWAPSCSWGPRGMSSCGGRKSLDRTAPRTASPRARHCGHRARQTGQGPSRAGPRGHHDPPHSGKGPVVFVLAAGDPLLYHREARL